MPSTTPKSKLRHDPDFREIVFKHFSVFIDCGIVPRKEMIVDLLEKNAVSDVTWERVRDLVWNEIKRRPKKKTANNFQETVVTFFQTAIDNRRLPPVADFADFLNVCSMPNANELPRKVVKSIVESEIKKKCKAK